VRSSPAIADIDNDGKLEVIIGSEDKKVYALNGENGSLLWSYETGGSVFSSPSIADIDNDGKLEIVVGSDDKKIYALNGENGSLLWSYETGGSVFSSPSIADIDNDGKLEIVVGSDDKKIYTLNGENGSLLWAFKTGGEVRSSPAIADINNDGKFEVVVGSNDKKIYALKGEDGSLLWSYKTKDWITSSPSIGDIDGDGKIEVVAGSDDGKIYALNGEDGSLLWLYKTGDYVWTSPSLGDIDNDGKLEVVIGANDWKIYALNCEDASLIWSYETGYRVFSSPSLADIDNDGKIDVVIGSGDGKIYAISTGSPVPSPELLPWPKFKHDLFNSGNYGGIKIKKKPKYPPYLTMKASIKDENGNNVIEGGERIDITIDVSNKGKGDAYAVKAVFLFRQGSQEIKEEKTIGDIEAGTSKRLSHSFSVPFNIKNGKCEIRIDVSDSNGYKAEEYLVGMGCAELPPPIFSVYSVIDDDLVGKSSGNGNGNIEAGETIELKLNVRNEGRGIGRDVEVHLSSTDDIDIIEDVAKIGNIPPDASGEGVVVFSVPGDFKKDRLSLELKVKEKTGLFSKTERKSYPVYKRVVAQEIGASPGGTVQTLPTPCCISTWKGKSPSEGC
jgi:outer membrane protein assembly factor BamB